MKEQNVSDLIRQWVSGNRSDVIDILECNHPYLAAVMIVQGNLDGDLSRGDACSIANLLTDRNVEKVRDGATQYRGCWITPKKGMPKYFGVNFPGADNDGYLKEWVRIQFPDGTWVLSANRESAQNYIDEVIHDRV